MTALHIKPVWQQIRLLTGLNMDGKTQHRYSTHFAAMLQDKLHVFCCPFFVARFSVPLATLCEKIDMQVGYLT